MQKPKLTIKSLIAEAKKFCEQESQFDNPALYGVTDGKAVGTLVEHKFKQFLDAKYEVLIGNAASGIDLPAPEILTDIKVTSIRQPKPPFTNLPSKYWKTHPLKVTSPFPMRYNGGSNMGGLLQWMRPLRALSASSKKASYHDVQRCSYW